MSLIHTLEVIGCRVYQAVFSLGLHIVPFHLPEYIDGPGSSKQLPAFLREKNCDDVLIVTDRGLMQLGLLNPVLEALDQAGIRYTCFSDLGPNPTIDNVEAGFLAYTQNSCKCLVAFGGGSPMDCAKAIGARVAHPNRSVPQMQGTFRVLKKIPPLFAIPTTSGTGSETTLTCVISDPVTHKKNTMNDSFLIPKYAILDPELTQGLPPFITATTGLDALSHAVESYINGTYSTKIEVEMARKAVKLIYDNLLTAYEDGKNMEARQNMQYAALYAGRAFTRGCVGHIHAIGHALGGLYGVPHGLAMSILMPYVLRKFGSAIHKPLAELADLCGIPGENDARKAEAFLSWMDEVSGRMGIPTKLDMIRDEDIEQIITWARKEAYPLYPVPVIWTREDFRQVIEAVRK